MLDRERDHNEMNNSPTILVKERLRREEMVLSREIQHVKLIVMMIWHSCLIPNLHIMHHILTKLDLKN